MIRAALAAALIFCAGSSWSGVVVSKTDATICFEGQCYPALIGAKTPEGEFRIRHALIEQGGYGGDVLAFKDHGGGVWDAIHRVYTLRPEQRRVQRLEDGTAADRRNVTLGCINVMPAVYQKLLECCTKATLVIQK